MSRDLGMVGRDVFLRFDGGPVQLFRAWDPARFIDAVVNRGLDAKEPYLVTVATAEEYRKQRAKR